jgi:hypothetical protein
MPSPIPIRRKINMKIAKRTLRITQEELLELLGLPEGIEILEVSQNKMDNDIDFLLGSAGEVEINGEKITIERNPSHQGIVRRLGLKSLRRILGKEDKPSMTKNTTIVIQNPTTDEEAKRLVKEIDKILKSLDRMN